MSVFKDKEKTKDGRQWRFKVYYHNEDGKLKPYTSKRYLLKKEAEAAERVFKLNRDVPVKKRFDVVADDYFKDAYIRLKESTVNTYYSQYKNNILPYFKNKFIDEINVSDIENWKNKLIDRKIKTSTCNEYYVVFKEIFTYANRKFELNYNPVSLSGRFKRRNDEVIKTEEKLRYITYEEYCKLIEVIHDDLYHCLFLTFYFAGMREGEMQALTWNDIDFNRKVVIVNKTLSTNTKEGIYKITNTKNCLNREISMSKILYEELKRYKEVVMKYDDFSSDWFVFGNGDFLSTYQMNKYRKIFFKEAGLEKRLITIHEFRHSHVSLCINEYIKSGQSDSTKFFLMMSQRMGHSLRVMQETYMHLFPSVQDNIVSLLDNL
uniref:Integrase n=1 Tax=Siphoviridae sp. ctUse40 TaxID=2826356 RepID=A0A8S5NEE2_9CAUD|nr:MAG TPA: Integrase [Siphoviridae sp. ctUse40]